MAKTIHALKFQATFDTKPLKDGMVLTRKEIGQAAKITDKFKSSSDRLAETQAKLQRLYSAGKITLDQANKEMAEAISLQKRLNSERARGGKLAATMNNAANGAVGRLGVAVAGALSVRALGQQIGNAVEQMDRLDHLSNKLTLPVEDLQRFAFAAQRFAETDLEGSANALATMNKSVYMLSQGNAKAVKTFEALGLEASQLEGLSINDKFLKIAEAIRNVGDEGARLALTQKIFGNGDLIGMFKASNQELDTMMNRLDELGGVKSAADVQRAAEIADKWQEAGIIWSSVIGDVTIAIAPLIDKLAMVANTVSEFSGGAKKAGMTWNDWAGIASLNPVGLATGGGKLFQGTNANIQERAMAGVANSKDFGMTEAQLDAELARRHAANPGAGAAAKAAADIMAAGVRELVAEQRKGNQLAEEQRDLQQQRNARGN